MYAKTISVLAGVYMLSASATARFSPEPSLAWNVTDLNLQCAENGCSYLFNIAGPTNPPYDTPAFNAQCIAQLGPMQSIYRSCEMGNNADGSPRPLSVQAYFNLDGTNYYSSEISVRMTYPDLSDDGPYDVVLTGKHTATYATFKATRDFQLFPHQTSPMAVVG